jgi:hypothetical protein
MDSDSEDELELVVASLSHRIRQSPKGKRMESLRPDNPMIRNLLGYSSSSDFSDHFQDEPVSAGVRCAGGVVQRGLLRHLCDEADLPGMLRGQKRRLEEEDSQNHIIAIIASESDDLRRLDTGEFSLPSVNSIGSDISQLATKDDVCIECCSPIRKQMMGMALHSADGSLLGLYEPYQEHYIDNIDNYLERKDREDRKDRESGDLPGRGQKRRKEDMEDSQKHTIASRVSSEAESSDDLCSLDTVNAMQIS